MGLLAKNNYKNLSFINSLINFFINNFNKANHIYKLSKNSKSVLLIVIAKYYYFKLKGKNIIAHHKVEINGVKNIVTKGELIIGLDYVGFLHKNDITFLNILGHLELLGNTSIGRGCRFDIGESANVSIGAGTYINPFTNIIIMHNLKIGENCAISWNCQFLDEDFHHMDYEGKKETKENDIEIGSKVWIGSNVSIYKGVSIPNGSIVASHSVVKKTFNEENVLIAGNPARIIKRNVSW